jgi:Cu/Ag efflux protein CusF
MTISQAGKRAFLMGILLALALDANAMDITAGDHATAKQVAASPRNAMTQPVAVATFHAIGFVTAVEPSGSLTINHEPIEGLMPAMEMTFSVKPSGLAKDVHAGDKIVFDVEGKTYVIVGLTVIEHAP